MKVLTIIVTPKNEDAQATVRSIQKQTVHSDIYCVIGVPSKNKLAGQIVGETINDYFCYIDLKEYDWIFKSDDDILYPKDFLEANLKTDYDVLGRDLAMLVKVEPFLKFMDGKWNETDMYGSVLDWTFLINNCKVNNDWVKMPLYYELPHVTPKRTWNYGKLNYQYGFPFLAHVEGTLKVGFYSNPIWLIGIASYIYCWIKKRPKDKNSSRINAYIKSRHQRLYSMS